MTDVSVVIPTYCESGTIGDVIESVRDAMGSRAHEIVVVDDSPDSRTAEAAANAVAVAGSPVHILSGPGTDLAGAVLHGFDEANGDRLVVLDGDGQHPAWAVPELVDALEDVDMAWGSRHAGGRNHAEWSATRVAMSFGASGIAWLAVPESRRLQDPMSGMVAIRRAPVEAVRDRLRPHGYKIGLELLARCPIDSVAEIPIEFDARDAGESNTDWRENLRYLRHMSRLAIATRRRERPTRLPNQEVGHVDG
jgi:dolichol-phosphate mannosyltransferase